MHTYRCTEDTVSKTLEAFIDCSDGDLSKPVPAQQFIERLMGHEVDESSMRQVFNGFHSTCPNFIVGSDDCPDCLRKHEAEHAHL